MFVLGSESPGVEYHTMDLAGDFLLVSGGIARQPWLVLADAVLVSLSRGIPDSELNIYWRRAFHNSFSLPSGEVCLTGGVGSISELSGRSETECYDPETGGGGFVPKEDAGLSQPRFGAVARELPGGNVLVCGGITGSRESLAVSSDVEMYNPPGWK